MDFEEEIKKHTEAIKILKARQAEERVSKIPDITGKCYKVAGNEYWQIHKVDDKYEDGDIHCQGLMIRTQYPTVGYEDLLVLGEYHREKCEISMDEFDTVFKEAFSRLRNKCTAGYLLTAIERDEN